MLTYWALYISAAVMAMGYQGTRDRATLLVWGVLAFLFVLAIGLRYEVGCDWLAYIRYYRRIDGVSFAELWTMSDPGYQLFNWISNLFDWKVYGANVFSAGVFMTGLVIFCRAQPYPWLALAVAVPYLVVVVSMGYTRQAVAIGLVFWALKCLEEKELKKYLVLVALATLFHKTAVLMVPLGLFLFGRGWAVRAMAVVLVGVGLWAAFVADYQADLWENYVMADMRSAGARVRVIMNLLPALLLLVFWRRWREVYPNSTVWLWMAFAAILCVPLLSLASTATDRIALYLTPLQIVVLSRLPTLLQQKDLRNVAVLGTLAGYALVLFVWLNYARHADCWVPYDNLLY